jgi:hypothetical protein
MNTEQKQTKARLPLKVGSRIRLIRDVERFSDFLVKAGAFGVCTQANEGGRIAVRMDELIQGAKEWDNEIWWESDARVDFDDDAEVLPFVRLVRIRCAGDGSYLKQLGANVDGHNVGDTFTLLKSEAMIFCETAKMDSEFRNYASFWGSRPMYYLEPCGDDVKTMTTPDGMAIRPAKPSIPVFNHTATGTSFFMLQDTLWGAPTNADGTVDHGNACPVKDWDDPLDEAGYQAVCAGLGIPVPAITFEARLQFHDGLLQTRYGRGNESKEQNAYDLITQIAQLPLSLCTEAHRRLLVGAVIRALGILLVGKPEIGSCHREEVHGTTMVVTQSRG